MNEKPETIQEKEAPTNPTNPTRIPIKLIDRHTKTCKECEQRRKFMMEYYKIPMDPNQHCNEWMARDEMLGN